MDRTININRIDKAKQKTASETFNSIDVLLDFLHIFPSVFSTEDRIFD